MTIYTQELVVKMLLPILQACLALVRCEWVEISQQHYRRPIHDYYPNQSLSHWEKPTENIKLNSDLKRPTAVVQRVPNIGSVKRVQLTNSPVKAPVKSENVDNDVISLNSDIFKDSYEEILSAEQQNKLRPSVNNKIAVIDNVVTNITPENITDTGKDKVNKFPKPVSDMKVSVVNEVLNKDEPQFVTKNDKIVIPGSAVNVQENQESIDRINLNINEKGAKLDPPKPDVTQNKVNSAKVNTMENLIKFMKVVTDTISRNTRRGVNSKVKYLNELKDVMLDSIKERIDATWPDDEPSGRRSRSATPRGHVEFPSSESALMTISFLTFAVFLIKLVLQVIQTYKHKAMIMAPVMVAAAGRHYARKQRKN